MRNLLRAFALLSVLGLGFWAYRENYATQAELSEMRGLRGDIGRLGESLAVLRAEWAYLNRPDRLRELADINFDRLGLLPLTPDQFGASAEVAYPDLALPEISQPIDTIAQSASQTRSTP
jgi:hypothetical protein